MVTAGKGHVAYNPGRHCLDILDSGEFRMEQYIHIKNKYQIVENYDLQKLKIKLASKTLETRGAVINQLF